MPDTNERLTPEQQAENVCKKLADAAHGDRTDYLAPQAIIAAAIREAEAEAESLRSSALAVELAIANRKLDDLRRAFVQATGQTYEAYIFDPSYDPDDGKGEE